MAGWLGKVAAGILGLAGATSCLLQVLSSFFQVTSTNIFSNGLFHNFLQLPIWSECEGGVHVGFVLVGVSSFMQPLLLPGGKASQ